MADSNLAAILTTAVAEEIEGAARLRRELHADADGPGAEYGTAARVAAALGASDAPVVAGTGRLCRIGPATGPCVAVRAELDALPVTEQTGVPWASHTGFMHACGHDVHLAALTAVGRAIRGVAARTALPAALLAALQPREEVIPSGARDIVDSEIFKDHEPRAVVGVHLQHELPAGTAGLAAGTVNASHDDFEITVAGVGGHAAYPHSSADPVLALCQAVVTLQQVVSRPTNPLHSAVVSVTTLQAGHAANVIPETAAARGTVRTLHEDDRAAMHAMVEDIVEHTCRAYGCQGVVRLSQGEPVLVNNEAMTAACWPLLREAGFAVDTSFRSCGSDDFSFYGLRAPTLMIFIGAGSEVSLHHPRFLPGDEAIGRVAAAMLAGYLSALDLL